MKLMQPTVIAQASIPNITRLILLFEDATSRY